MNTAPYQKQPNTTVSCHAGPHRKQPKHKPFGQTRRDGSNVPACQHRVNLPHRTIPDPTQPDRNIPFQTRQHRKDLQALRLESPKLRTPVAEADLRTGYEHPFVNTGWIDERVFDLQFYHALPSIEHGASAGDTSLTDTHDGYLAESLILPKFVNTPGTVVLQDGMSQAEHGRFSESPFLALLGSVDNSLSLIHI